MLLAFKHQVLKHVTKNPQSIGGGINGTVKTDSETERQSGKLHSTKVCYIN